jgi:DNA polymerase III gamma/tau subunit
MLGDGSFRDTLGILQKVVGTSNDTKISISEVENITDAPKGNVVNDFIQALTNAEKENALSLISKALENNISIKTFIALVIEKIRTILILRNAPNLAKDIQENLSEDDWKIIEKLAKAPESRVNSSMLLELLKAYNSIGKAHIGSIPLELAVIDICA